MAKSKVPARQTCAICGCHDFDACVDGLDEPCHWVAPGLCSACVVFVPWLAFAAIAGAGMPMPPAALHTINAAINELRWRKIAGGHVPPALREIPDA